MNVYKNILIVVLGISILGSCTKDPIQPAGQGNKIEMATPSIKSLTQISAVANANVEGPQYKEVIDKGFCWGTSINPTVFSTKLSSGGGTGSFSGNLSALVPGVNYYLRAYFQTKSETIYSSNVTFRTVDYQIPSVITLGINGITQTSVVGSGTVFSAGGGTVSARGFCWNTSSMPTISDNRMISGMGVGNFSADVVSLKPGTLYYVRAYAINQAGVGYGTQYSFTTLPVKLATVGALTLNSSTKNSAYLAGNVSADGGGTISSRGICYAASTVNPTTPLNPSISNGAGIGTVGGTISGLTSATTYYARAFAVNQAGVSYGPVFTFRTM